MSRTPGYQPKIRNANNRKRKSVILLATEGKNKTKHYILIDSLIIIV